MFTPEELKNIQMLINLAPIRGDQALTVALLQEKIRGLLNPRPTSKVEGTQEEPVGEVEVSK